MTKIKILFIVIALHCLALHAGKEFLYNKDGFKFPNYTNQYNPVNLTPANVERLCGHVSCIRGTGNSCVLRAPMQEVMKRNNKSMNGGHCDGFTVASEAILTGYLPLNYLDTNAATTFSLKQTPAVQSEIAYWHSTQWTQPTQGAKMGPYLPNQALNILRNAGNERYALHMFNANWTDGHSVETLRVIDESNDKAKLAIYDSNYPNQTRLIFVDKKKNTWDYSGYPPGYPEKKLMLLVPMAARLKAQRCPETGLADAQPAQVKPLQQTPQVKPKQQSAPQVATPQQAKHPEVWPKGTQPQWVEEDENQNEEYEEDQEEPEQWNLQIDNDAVEFGFGMFLGLMEAFVGQSVNQVPFTDTKASNLYRVPVGKDRHFQLVARNLKAKEPANLYITSRGHAMVIEGIKPYKGQNDEVFLAKDGETISYSTKSSAPVTLTIAESLKDGDYTIKIKPTVKTGGFDVLLHNIVDKRYGFHELELTLANHDKSEASYAIEMTRMTTEGDATFTHNNTKDLKVKPGEVNSIEYGLWHNDKESLTVVDKIAGQVEKSLQISDEQ